MSKNIKAIALIPARSGSKRIIDKNIKLLKNRPLLAYTIYSALECKCFNRVICSTDSEYYADIASQYGAEVIFRPKKIASSTSPDYEWVKFTTDVLQNEGYDFNVYSILRPTSPFRTEKTIKRAFKLFNKSLKFDSLRAVELCGQHPGKMWSLGKKYMTPILNKTINGTPWHSNQYALLPKIYVQNASLEIAWLKTLVVKKSISGSLILPFITKALEGFDINTHEDWLLAEHYIRTKHVILPKFKKHRSCNGR
jgi:CMP-N,N'-diacetyllegionaminic acid synthase